MSNSGLLPEWTRPFGWLFLAGQSLLIARIVYESKFLTCWNGPPMVGFAMFHGAHNFFLLGFLFLPLGLLFTVAMLLLGLFKKLRFSRNEWLLLSGYLLGFGLLSVPYPLWERLDRKVWSAGPLGDGLLIQAARAGELNVVTRLAREGHNVNPASGEGTPLSGAVKGGRQDVARFLLEKGANANSRGRYSDETPLMLTASAGDTEMAKLLLDHGADACAVKPYSDNETAQRIA